MQYHTLRETSLLEKMSFKQHLISIFEFFKETELQIYCIDDPSPKCTTARIQTSLEKGRMAYNVQMKKL